MRADPQFDVVVVGGGPAGLALAIDAAGAGHSTVVLERQRYPVDKACGEGVMPAGVALLEVLGVRARLGADDCHPFRGIRYVQEDGTGVAGLFPRGATGLGIRRSALSLAMADRAREAGAQLREQTRAMGWSRSDQGVRVQTTQGEVTGRLLVAADGLHSSFRRPAAQTPRGAAQRFGVRRHYALAPWTDAVEVHFAPGAEAYVTPVGRERVGVAFLWSRAAGVPATYDGLLASFPSLQQRLAGAPVVSEVRGAGPLAQTAAWRVEDRLVLLGDAGGYVDAITGEGLTLAFRGARALARALPDALTRGCTRVALAPYAEEVRRHYRRYWLLTRAVLWVGGRPALRRRLLKALGRLPTAFERLLHAFAAA